MNNFKVGDILLENDTFQRVYICLKIREVIDYIELGDTYCTYSLITDVFRDDHESS